MNKTMNYYSIQDKFRKIPKKIRKLEKINSIEVNELCPLTDFILASNFRKNKLLISNRCYYSFKQMNLSPHSVEKVKIKSSHEEFVIINFKDIYGLMLNSIEYEKSEFYLGYLKSLNSIHTIDECYFVNKKELISKSNELILSDKYYHDSYGQLAIFPKKIKLSSKFDYDYFHFTEMFISNYLKDEIIKHNLTGLEIEQKSTSLFF
ncbi:hypothetical protein [Flammeovirga agarivorans]|uniref:Uncharacterized protein n=1 Tax=Flammeovirga agarivorans TaxID=2726742 RepID=A0A7X8XW64_9BACT|nr:hypothetical protein [Flammeovirga agarivorans]NLR92012.1 hypothetical protein [Flammeovirga agarivorans]